MSLLCITCKLGPQFVHHGFLMLQLMSPLSQCMLRHCYANELFLCVHVFVLRYKAAAACLSHAPCTIYTPTSTYTHTHVSAQTSWAAALCSGIKNTCVGLRRGTASIKPNRTSITANSISLSHTHTQTSARTHTQVQKGHMNISSQSKT